MSCDPIVDVLRTRRELSGITQEVLADSAGISLRTLQRIESGSADMKISQYRSIIRVLGMTDLDVSLDMLGVEGVDVDEIAAATRGVPPSVRKALLNLMISIYKDVRHK
ncbi:helix-turn-helix transcriptional regulator [Vibrio fluvialis]|nr:helix-turn-helix transcriptional regulator [Vibrio fluvialis]